MPESCDVGVPTQEELRRALPLQNRMEQLRGDYLRVPTWKLPPSKQIERFQILENQRKSLEAQVAAQQRSLSEMMNDELKSCRGRLQKAVQEAKEALGIED